MPQPPRNLALRNLSDNLRQKRSQAAAVSKELCSLHSEKLRLFCQEDQQLICLVCRDAKQHKKHNCVPIDEAAEEYRTKVKIGLMDLKSKLGSFEKEKLCCDKMAIHINLQAQNTEKTIKAGFKKLYQFLRAEEAGRIDAVRKEAALKSETMNMRIANLTAEISSLSDKIKTIQGEMKARDLSFMQNVKSTTERFQCKLPEPVTPSGALIDEAKHVGNLLFLVWNKMKTIIQYTPVTLNPNTACQELTVSENLTCSTLCSKSQSFPGNPERLGNSDVLGYEGFRSGKYFWDVEVDGYWTVGVVIRNSAQIYRKILGVYKCICTNFVREITPEDDTELVSNLLPQKVRVHLD